MAGKKKPAAKAARAAKSRAKGKKSAAATIKKRTLAKASACVPAGSDLASRIPTRVPRAGRNAPWVQCIELAPGITLYQGDCTEVMAALEPASVHSVVTDPPYELGFMGKAWDKAGGVASNPATWAHALAALRPGGHLVAFAGSRTYHRIACAIEDAGFEIRDQLMWLYGSGFPKSLDVAKCIDKAGGYGGVARATPWPATHARRCCAGTRGRQKGRPSSMTLAHGTAGARR